MQPPPRADSASRTSGSQAAAFHGKAVAARPDSQKACSGSKHVVDAREIDERIEARLGGHEGFVEAVDLLRERELPIDRPQSGTGGSGRAGAL